MKQTTEFKFTQFEKRIDEQLLSHPVITDNRYCAWFADAELDIDEVRHFTVQFSVFSNQFLIAQLHKMINAVDLEEMHAAKEILANELGCVFKRKTKEQRQSVAHRNADTEDRGDPELVNTEGTVDGGTFRFRAAHFEWLLNFAKPLGLEFKDLGKRPLGTKNTLFFCDELIRIYGNEDFNIAAGASFAVENWAAQGFWKQLIKGLKAFKAAQVPEMPVSFFTWHDRVEDQHAQHTRDELRELYFGPHAFDEDKFLAAGKEMLEGVAVFWEGLNQDRLDRARRCA